MVRPVERPIKISTPGDLERALKKAQDSPVLLEHRGVIYRLSRDEGMRIPTMAPDADLVHRTLDVTSGTWADLDIERITHDVYEARGTGSRNSKRP